MKDQKEDEEEAFLKDGSFIMPDTKHDLSQGAKLTFSFNEGLIVQIQPNGDCV